MKRAFEKQGFFDCLDSIYKAISENKIKRIQEETLPPELKKLGCINVVLAEGLPQDQQKLSCIRDTIYGGFYAQLGPNENIDGVNFDYGIADLDDKKYFYYVWPDDKPLETKLIGEYLTKIKNMFKDTSIRGFTPDEKVHIGPFPNNDMRFFQKISERLMTFKQCGSLKTGIVESSEGLKLSFDRAAYLSLFDDEHGFSPLLRQDQVMSPTPAKPKLH